MLEPTQEEKLNAEEATIIEPTAPAAPLDAETVDAIIESIALTPGAMEKLVARLFVNASFKNALAAAFVGIYDHFTKLVNNATHDFQKSFQIRILNESEGNNKEFFIRYLTEDTLEFSVTDETGTKHLYDEPNPGVLAAALEALRAIGAVPSAEIVHTALIEPAAASVSIEGVDGVIAATSTFTSDPEAEASVHIEPATESVH